MAASRISRVGRQLLANSKGRPSTVFSSARLGTSPLFQRIARPIPAATFGTPRFASTSATAATTVSDNTDSASAANHAASAPSEGFLAPDATIDIATSIQPHAGYLKELGLDYGWGPTSLVQWIVESMQVSFDMPMWGAVVGAVLATRLAMLPLIFKSSDNSSRMAVMSPLMKPLQKQMTLAATAGDQAKQLQLKRELSAIMKHSGIQYRWMFIPVLIQGPLGYGLFRFTGGMASLPLPELQNTVLGWMTDLSAHDPYFILPLLTSGTIYITLRAGGEQAEMGGGNPQVLVWMRRIMPTLTMVFTGFLPAITQIGFLAGSVWAYFQSALLRSESVRHMLNIHPLPGKGAKVWTAPGSEPAYAGKLTREDAIETQAPPKPTGFAGMRARAQEKIEEVQKSAREAIEKRESKHERLTKTELSSAEKYEARKAKAVEQERQHQKAREDAQRRNRLSKVQKH